MVSGKILTAAHGAALAIAIGIVAAAGLQAQGSTSIITGVVRDSSGAAVPGATVRVVNETSGAAREIVSTEDGTYRADQLAPGQYRIEIALDGFEAPALVSGNLIADAGAFNVNRLKEQIPPSSSNVEGYSLLNARVGFRASDGWTLSLWSRNLLDKDYFDLLSPVAGGTGLYVGQPGDRRTIGLTMRITLGSSRP